MGGTAFAQAHADGEPTLNTPRMTPKTYNHLKALSVKKLQKYFPSAKISPYIEAPEKKDYGDIDVFVAVDQRVDFTHLAPHLGAAGVIRHDNTKATFAIPLDGTASKRAPVVYSDVNGKPGCEKPSAPTTTEEYAQIDLTIVSPDLFDWYTFYSSYSDLAGMVGHLVTNLGFTVSDKGFFVRLPELDFSKTIDYANVADRDATIFLTSKPEGMMSFIGCSDEEFQKGFKTREELFSWLGECRLISPSALRTKRSKPSKVKRKERNRPIFNTFFNEWLPTNKNMQAPEEEERRKSVVEELRKKLLQEAVDFFVKREEYETKQHAATLAIANGLAADRLKPIIIECSGVKVDSKQLNEIVKAFRRRVEFDEDKRPEIASEPHTDEQSQLHYFLNREQMDWEVGGVVYEWVRKNWEELRGLERQRTKLGEA